MARGISSGLIRFTAWIFLSGPVHAELPATLPVKPFGTRADAALLAANNSAVGGSGSNFNQSVFFKEIPGTPGHFVVVQLNGFIYHYVPATGATSLWMRLDCAQRTRNSSGVYSLAFHPRFTQNRRYFIQYHPVSNDTLPNWGEGKIGAHKQVLDEFRASDDSQKDGGVPGKRIMEIGNFDGAGHHGMATAFGKDGMLYLTLGEGGSSGRETQSRRSYMGTVIRIDVDHADPGSKYGIPLDNPFAKDTDPLVKKEIWSYGFRNNFKLSVDALTGELWVGNVGGWNEDQIFRLRKAGNFGWPITEGTLCFDASKGQSGYTKPLAACDRTGITGPDIVLPHPAPLGAVNTTCVIGPHVYRANPASGLYGVLFYADATGNRLLATRLGPDGKVLEQKEYKVSPPIIHLDEAEDGKLIVMGLGGNSLLYLDSPELLRGRPATGLQGAGGARIVKPPEKARFDLAGRKKVRGR